MKTMLVCVFAVLFSVSAMAEQHDSVKAEVRDAVKAFNDAYGSNRVEDYFHYYADDASLYFDGARQDVQDYHDEWAAMIDGGGGVERNELSDLQVRVMPGGDVALASYFIDYRLRTPNGDVSAAKAFESDVWQRIGGDWKIVGLHYSEIEPEE